MADTQQQQAPAAQRPPSPFDLLGGEPVVRAIVDRFYDLMDGDPAYGELRAMHASDLAPMRRSLAGFLTAWAGGPRDWFDERPGACVMTLHAPLAITPAVAGQWSDAMGRAIAGQPGLEPRIAAALADALSRMALAIGRT